MIDPKTLEGVLSGGINLPTLDSSFPVSGAAASGGQEGFNPNALAYFMAMMGKGINPKGFGGIVGEDVQNQVRTNNFGKLLKQALSGGGKVTIDGDKTTLNIPHGPEGIASDTKSAVDGSETALKEMSAGAIGNAFTGGSNVNVPFSPGPQATGIELNPSDLLGLTTSDLMGITELKRRVDQEPFERMKDIVQMKYTMGMLSNMEADNELAFYKELTKDDRTDLQKNYDFATSQGFKGNFMDYLEQTKNDSIADYKYAVNQGYGGTYRQWVLDMKKAGGTHISIGEKVENTKALELAKADAQKVIEIQSNDFITNVEKSVRSAMESEKKLNRRTTKYTEEQLATLKKDNKVAYDKYMFDKLPVDQRIKIKTVEELNNRIVNALDPQNTGKVTAVNKNGTIFWYYTDDPKDQKNLKLIRKY